MLNEQKNCHLFSFLFFAISPFHDVLFLSLSPRAIGATISGSPTDKFFA